jgi:hypothetical protein
MVFYGSFFVFTVATLERTYSFDGLAGFDISRSAVSVKVLRISSSIRRRSADAMLF